MIVMRVFILVVAVFIGACQPTPSPTPKPDAGDAGVVDGDPCTLACAQLAALGCPEGKADDCARTCNHAQRTNLTDLKPACLAAAKSAAEARACGTVACKVTP